MPNMSYIMFENTLSDLIDCQNELDEGCYTEKDFSKTEEDAMRSLIRICRDISNEHGHLIE